MFNELPILFEIEGIAMKSMPDKLIISHIDTMRDFTDILLEIKQEEGLSKIVF